MKFLEFVDNWLRKFELGLLVFLLAVMVSLGFLQVVLRNVFSTGIIWGDILLRYIVLWMGFLGGALATSNQRHINIDAFAHFMSVRTKSVLSAITNLFAAVVCWALVQASWRFVESETEARSLIFGQVQAWWAELIIPVGFGLHVVHFLIRTVRSARVAIKGETET